ncbi:MAG: helveticin J family class III bacteriocin, partial [Lactobacillus equicursoris]
QSPREIVKIPWGEADSKKWSVADLDREKVLDQFGFATEFEGIQVSESGDLYLTVAYHAKDNGTTLKNRIYRISSL